MNIRIIIIIYCDVFLFSLLNLSGLNFVGPYRKCHPSFYLSSKFLFVPNDENHNLLYSLKFPNQTDPTDNSIYIFFVIVSIVFEPMVFDGNVFRFFLVLLSLTKDFILSLRARDQVQLQYQQCTRSQYVIKVVLGLL